MKDKKKNRYLRLLLILIVLIGTTAGTFAQQPAKTKDPSVPIENLTFQAADIRSVIRFLADYGQVNVVVAPNVQGTVTINLRNIAWDQALKIVGSTYGLAVVFDDEGFIRILLAEEYRQELTSIERHNNERISLASLEVKIVRLANTAADEIKSSVESLLTDRGKVDADKRTNSLILQEVPENIARVVEFINELDRPARQIKISTQILEISSNNNIELGIDWSASGAYEPNPSRSISQTGTQIGNRVSDQFIKYNIGLVQRGWDLNATIAAMISDGRGKIIAHPEITTVDNMEARIQMGQRIPIKQYDESGNTTIKFEDVGTILRVTPHITAENRILMHLRPERSTLQPDPVGIIINTSNAETNVVVNNGQTAVIGGLTTQDEVESEIGIPILKDIPIIGALFKYTQKKTESRDLVIFVTPTIVDDDFADATP